MEVYNPQNRCVKCFNLADVTYKARFNIGGVEYTDVMLRKCLICGYEWLELPQDHSSGP